MKNQLTATVVDGSLVFDQPLTWPDQSRVQVVIESVSPATAETHAAWQRLKQRIRERPVHAHGLHYSRDELHERR